MATLVGVLRQIKLELLNFLKKTGLLLIKEKGTLTNMEMIHGLMTKEVLTT